MRSLTSQTWRQSRAAHAPTGLVTSFLLELTVYPAIFAIWKGRQMPVVTRAPLETSR